MVAFLRALPEMDAATYRELAYGTASAAVHHATDFEGAVSECSRCHGHDGSGGGPATPVLAGQSGAYLATSMRAFAEARRESGFMALPAAAVDADAIDRLAQHFAALPWGSPAPEGEAAADSLARGEQIARNGIPAEGVPACLGCHGEDRNPLYPRIGGQKQSYLAEQLKLFQEGKRGGGPFSHLMRNAAKGLTIRDIDDLAAYFAARADPAR